MKILLAVNDSTHSERAVRFVTGMRWPAGSRVIVATLEQLRCASAVTSTQARLRAAGISTELRVVEGDPRAALPWLIETERVDLLVMGSPGRGSPAQLLLGSAANRAVTHAKCSVLVVKQSAMADRGKNPTRPNDAMKILIGVDESPLSRAAVEMVRRMEWPKDTMVMVLSVAQPVLPMGAELHTPAAAFVELDEVMVRTHARTVSEACAALRGRGLETETKVLHGDPRTVLVEAARSERADLVVVGSHGRTGLAELLIGSVAQHVVTFAPCSVLVVKLKE